MTDKKLTYQMLSPGEAWNNFVNSKEGHNAIAVTPAYLDSKLRTEEIDLIAVKPKLFKEAISLRDLQQHENHTLDKGDKSFTIEK